MAEKKARPNEYEQAVEEVTSAFDEAISELDAEDVICALEELIALFEDRLLEKEAHLFLDEDEADFVDEDLDRRLLSEEDADGQ